MKDSDGTVVFLDTSALVKRYHVERGTDIVDAAFQDDRAERVISDISVIEFHSAFAKKVRTREIDRADFRATIRMLSEDIRRVLIKLAFFGDQDKQEAVRLVKKYALSRSVRTLDAMQLAVIRTLGLRAAVKVYCADRTFAAVAGQEGYTVVNPEEPAPQ